MRKPDLVIGDPARPYMLRWHILKWRNLPRVYVHKFLRSDDDRAPHNHPWWFVSVLLKGSYIEHRWVDGVHQTRRRTAPSIAFRPMSTWHRVELETKDVMVHRDGKWWVETREYFAWTLIVTGKDVRGWGFLCPKDRFVPSHEFRGCGE